MRVYAAADERFFDFDGHTQFDELRKTDAAVLFYRRGDDARLRVFTACENRRVRLSRRHDRFLHLHGVLQHAFFNQSLSPAAKTSEEMPDRLLSDDSRGGVRQSVARPVFALSFRRFRRTVLGRDRPYF